MSVPRENARDKAARLGLELVLPADNELFIDLDTLEAIDEFKIRFGDFTSINTFKHAKVQYTTSANGNTHVIVTLPDEKFTVLERIALQAALGSDPIREMIDVDNQRDGYEFVSVLFEKPGTTRRDTPLEVKETTHAD